MFGRRDDVRRLAAGPGAERDDRRMLEQEERVADRSGAPLLDQLFLQLDRRVVVEAPEATDRQVASGLSRLIQYRLPGAAPGGQGARSENIGHI